MGRYSRVIDYSKLRPLDIARIEADFELARENGIYEPSLEENEWAIQAFESGGCRKEDEGEDSFDEDVYEPNEEDMATARSFARETIGQEEIEYLLNKYVFVSPENETANNEEIFEDAMVRSKNLENGDGPNQKSRSITDSNISFLEKALTSLTQHPEFEYIYDEELEDTGYNPEIEPEGLLFYTKNDSFGHFEFLGYMSIALSNIRNGVVNTSGPDTFSKLTTPVYIEFTNGETRYANFNFKFFHSETNERMGGFYLNANLPIRREVHIDIE